MKPFTANAKSLNSVLFTPSIRYAPLLSHLALPECAAGAVDDGTEWPISDHTQSEDS